MSESRVPSPGGCVFKSVANAEGGDVGGDTHFWFDQSGDLIHAAYRGETVRLGHLVGRHHSDTLGFRCSHVTGDGTTATGRSTDRVERLEDSRLHLHEDWSWSSKPGSGTSVLEDLTGEEHTGFDLSPETSDGR